MIEAVIRFPAMLRREQQTALIIQISMLAAALAVTLLAWMHMRRAWRRQADLAEQKDNFLASVSHELRTPLASVRTLTENLAAGTVSDEAARQNYYAVMLHEMQRLSGLVENVLDFARISQDRKHYHFVPCDPADLLAEALRPMRPLAAKRSITLTESIAPLPQTPLADAGAMQQSLINLVDNALKFSPAHSTVRVIVRPHGDGWELCVEDEGPGIPAGEEERIFERFYRAGTELRRETPGAGIGLSLVQHTAHGHGGTAYATNRPEGGARAGLRLPFSPPPPPRP
jgi:two-component system, OmpR family, phosphate regulon sensor histidine kinase PhoR